ncbi:globin domain-containing protein [Tahibacter sp. UC22_41]|uniref:globin domain-containing protein n=1 Tax=Tahibacter sp. UC22_41 TaxID=3350178 RepID=UPI002C202C85|nr:globin domain-containing protein [Tahibacter sp.]
MSPVPVDCAVGPTLDAQQIAYVRHGLARIAANAEAFAADLQRSLSGTVPALRILFLQDPREQSARLLRLLARLDGSLARMDDLRPALSQFGARYAAYGLRNEHYDALGRVLLQTLARHADIHRNPHAEEAWLHLYQIVSTQMRRTRLAA